MIKKTGFLIIYFIVITVAIACSKSPAELMEEARILRERGYNDSATAIYREVLKNDPENSRALMEFADLMIEIKNYSYAITLYKQYLTLHPEEMKIRELIIDIYQSTGANDLAITECLDFLKRDPDNLFILNKLKDIYQKNHLTEPEIAILEKIQEMDPQRREITKRLAEAYIEMGEYRKSVKLIDIYAMAAEFPEEKLALIYLKSELYDRAIKIYEEAYERDPSEENRLALLRARLAKVNSRLARTPRAYDSFYNPLSDTLRYYGPDRKLDELVDYADRRIGGVYAGFINTNGKSGDDTYMNNYGRIFYPVLSSGTEISFTTQSYSIGNQNLSSAYTQTGIELSQALGSDLLLSGGYHSGIPGSTWFGQIMYRSDVLQLAARLKKDYHIVSPEVLESELSYTGAEYYANWYPLRGLSLFGHLSNIDFSDGNKGFYVEYGGFYRLWENKRDLFLDIGLYNNMERFSFASPLYFSPDYFSLWNATLEWNYYWTKDSLLRLAYTYSTGNQGASHNIYSVYADHRFSEDFFLFGEYINGFNRLGRIGLIEQPGLQDHELNIGIKCKF